MAIQIGRLLGDVLSGGSTYFKRQKKAKKKEKEANALIRENTDMAQELYDRDLGQSQWENVSADPALRQAQTDALSRMEGLSRTGFSDLDRQALDQAFMQSRQEEQGQRQAALTAAARRGDVSGGNALQAALMAEQGGANRAAQFATDVGLAGRDRALNALSAYGQQAGQMRGQDFGEQAQRAQGIQGFNQWATGQKSQDAQFLNNARLGQASNLQAQAAQMQATPALDAGVNAYANWATGGLAGNVAGGGSQPAAQSTPQTQFGGASGLGMGHEMDHKGIGQVNKGDALAPPGAQLKGMGQIDKTGGAASPQAPQQITARRRRPTSPRTSGGGLGQMVANLYRGST